MAKGRKDRVLRRFQQLSSYRDDTETQNREEIPLSSRIVPRGLSVAEDHRQPPTTAHIYIATRRTFELMLGSQVS